MKATNLLMAVLLTLGLGACEGDPSGDIKTTTAPAENADARDAFVGFWQALSGNMTTSCAGHPPDSNTTAAALRWNKNGDTTELVASGSGGFCPLTAHVSGRTASVLPSQACIATDGGYTQFTIERTAYTFTISTDAPTVATEESSGTMQTNEGGTVTANCTYQGTAVYRKLAP